MIYTQFYKDQYDKALDKKNEINTSLATPIGILTALIGSLFYATSNFNFLGPSLLTITFSLFALISIILLGISIYRLIRAFSDFHNGLEYGYLNDTDVLDNYYKTLIRFNTDRSISTIASVQHRSKDEFDQYILSELIRNTGINQRKNRKKIFHRFHCHQYIIYALISLSLLVIPFGIDYCNNKDRVQKVKIESPISLQVILK